MSRESELKSQIRASETRVAEQIRAVDREVGEAKKKASSRLQLLETELKNLRYTLSTISSDT